VLPEENNYGIFLIIMDILRTPDFWRYTPYMTNKYGHGKEFDEKDMDDMLGIREQLWTLKNGVKISCNIPVCGHQEQKNIYRCLSCFAQQEPETYPTFEVNLLVNSPEPTQGHEYNWKETKLEIERFKKEHPEIIVNVAYFRFQWKFDIGLIRSHLTDARMLEVSELENHLFASYDADMMDMSGEYMIRLPHLFQKPEYQLLAGRFKDSDDMLCYDPAQRIAWVLRPLLWEKRRKSSGGNMVFRVSAYEEVWWYQKTGGDVWEDGALGWAIRKNNQENHHSKNLRSVRQWNSAITITSSARRKISKLLDNDGEKPEYGYWHSKWSDGSVVKDDFWHQEAYREMEYTEDLRLLKLITSDAKAWQEFLGDLTREIKDALMDFFENQMKWGTTRTKEDIQNAHIPKKWNQAMRILWIEKWNINVSTGSGNQTIPNIDLQILEAEGLKEKLKTFIVNKEKLQ